MKIAIGGMSCQHCVRAVRSALESIDGVTVSSVDIGEAEIGLDETKVSWESISAAIIDAGFEPVVS